MIEQVGNGRVKTEHVYPDFDPKVHTLDFEDIHRRGGGYLDEIMESKNFTIPSIEKMINDKEYIDFARKALPVLSYGGSGKRKYIKEVRASVKDKKLVYDLALKKMKKNKA